MPDDKEPREVHPIRFGGESFIQTDRDFRPKVQKEGADLTPGTGEAPIVIAVDGINPGPGEAGGDGEKEYHLPPDGQQTTEPPLVEGGSVPPPGGTEITVEEGDIFESIVPEETTGGDPTVKPNPTDATNLLKKKKQT